MCLIVMMLQVAGSIIGKGGQNITKLRSQVSIINVELVLVRDK